VGWPWVGLLLQNETYVSGGYASRCKKTSRQQLEALQEEERLSHQQQMQEDLSRQQQRQAQQAHLANTYCPTCGNPMPPGGECAYCKEMREEIPPQASEEEMQREAQSQEEEKSIRQQQDEERLREAMLRQQQQIQAHQMQREQVSAYDATGQAGQEQQEQVQEHDAQVRVPSSLPVSAPPPTPPLTPDDYVDRLLKYIPAESVALYLTLQGIILSGAAEASSLNTWLWFILGVGLIGTAVYQWRVLKIGKVVQLAVSTAAFGVWVFALGGAFASLSWYEPFIGSLTLVIFTFFAPLISPDVLSTEQE
jgi:hypothetical protein